MLFPCSGGAQALCLLNIALVLLAGCGSGDDKRDAPGREPSGHARVTKVSDGDTIHLSGIGATRLIGIDTPEVFTESECFGREASAFLKKLLPLGTRVRYRAGVEERDRYGRFLAYVYLRDGRMANRVLVQKGYAQPLTIPPNVEFADAFRDAARAARRAGRGLWRACVGSA